MIELLKGVSGEEIILLDALVKLAKEAQSAVKLIENQKYEFIIGNDIHVYHEEASGGYVGEGYLTTTGIYLYHDNWGENNHWKVNCTVNGIYECYKAEYMYRNKMAYLLSDEEKHLAQFAKHLRSWIRELGDSK